MNGREVRALLARKLDGAGAERGGDLGRGVPVREHGLVPLIERGEGITVLLTRRTEHLDDHPGQISFPGGRAEADDTDPVETALRETEEEIGLARRHVDVVGRLATYDTVTGFRIAPVIGMIAPRFTLELDPFEVAEAFEVPLSFILDRGNCERRGVVFEGRERETFAFAYEGRVIWGATAGMLVRLRDKLHNVYGDNVYSETPC